MPQIQSCWLGVGRLSMLFLDRGIRDEAWSTGHTEKVVQQSSTHNSLKTGSTQENIGFQTAVGTGDDLQSHATGCSSEWTLIFLICSRGKEADGQLQAQPCDFDAIPFLVRGRLGAIWG